MNVYTNQNYNDQRQRDISNRGSLIDTHGRSREPVHIVERVITMLK